MDEQTVIQNILDGDQNAFRELVNEYQDMVYNTVYGFVHDEDDAMDLSQDVFIEIYQSLSKFRKESSLTTWIYRISVNKALNDLRKQKKTDFISRISGLFNSGGNHEIEKIQDQETHPHERLENKELSNKLLYAIDSLPKNQRIAFVLHKLEDLPYKEIAGIMDISLSSVESLIFRARKGLQKKLLHYFQEI